MTVASAAPTPSVPTRTVTPHIDVRAIFAEMAHGAWQALTSSPLLACGFALFVVCAISGMVRAAMYPKGRRDVVRLFTAADKRVILIRAGGRCEHHAWPIGRCRTTEHLEADHVHPHSRGGWTDLSNGQALCRQHNRAKRDSVPYGWQLRGLAKRRSGYFPADVSPVIIRRQPARPRGRRAVAG